MGHKRKKLELKANTLEEIQLRDQFIWIETSNYEVSLDLTGNGKFSHMVLSACAFGLLAVGFQNGVTAYLLPSAKCDLNISTNQIGYVNVAFMIGGISSACLWGITADMIGRQKILLTTLIADSFVTILSALSQDYSMLLIMRFFNGFFIGGPGCLVFTYLGDMIPLKRRTKYICYIGFCFILSWIFLPALAFLIMPLKFQIYMTGNVKFNSWRLYLLVSSLPSIMSAFLFSKLPESPRLLLANKRNKEATNVLKSMFSINTGRSDKEYLVLHAINCPGKRSISITQNSQMSISLNGGRVSRLLRDILTQITAIFKKPFTIKSIMVMFIFFANMFGCYGFGLWIPELLSRFRKYSNLNTNSVTTVCQLTNSAILARPNVTASHILGNNSNFKDFDFYYDAGDVAEKKCENIMDYQGFKDTMTIGMACLLYNVISVYVSDWVSAKVLPAISLAIAGVAAATFVWVSSPLYCLTAASVFQSAMTTGNIVIVGLVMDAFPSNVSSMAVCIATLAGRVGSICSNLFFGSFMDFSCQIPIFLVAALSIGGSTLVFFVKHRPNEDENLNENQDFKIESIDGFTDCNLHHVDLNQITQHI